MCMNHLKIIMKKWWDKSYGKRETYTNYYNEFPNVNKLAENLYNKDLNIKKLSNDIMNNHMLKYNYTDFFKNINIDNILFILRFEHYKEDMDNILYPYLKKEFGVGITGECYYESDDYIKWKINNKKMMYLSELAIKNLKKWYTEDFKLIQNFIDRKLLPENYLDEILNENSENWCEKEYKLVKDLIDRELLPKNYLDK